MDYLLQLYQDFNQDCYIAIIIVKFNIHLIGN